MGNKKIKERRKKIDEIDKKIIREIVKRVKLAREIGKIKRKNKEKIEDKEREGEVLEKTSKLAKKKKINPQRIKNIFKEIIKLCKEEES